jgi:PBP4 family serine-type D-alanyl-D-alanine carboxypeptidase
MNKTRSVKLFALVAAILLVGALNGSVLAQSNATLEQRIKKIMDRPEFAHSRFGIELFSMDTGKVIYQLNQQQLFVPGSTTKLLTEGTALELLGGDYRFHTKVYRTGPIKKNGVIDGDLVLVGSGDYNLSNRVQPDGTLAFEDEDHSYGGPDSKGLAGDPLLVIHEFAQQIAAKGIKRVKGKILVDATLFPEGEKELGTGVVISPIVVNDNVVDVIVTPAATEGAPAMLKVFPQTGYVKIVNQVTTGGAGSKASLDYTAETLNADGTRSVTLAGSLPIGAHSTMSAYAVPEPSRYAATLLVEALAEKGVRATIAPPNGKTDFKLVGSNYKEENVVAEHVSPPLKEDVKITLKVSQNLHASMTPFVLGSVLGKAQTRIDQAGFDLENNFLTKAGLDLTGASQTDGAGGNAYYSPDFVVHYLMYMAQQKDYADFYRALPILGKDGTLFKIQMASPAAGHVHAKTGTYGVYDALNKNLMVTGKGLAGYMDTASGQRLVLALYVNMVAVPLDEPEATQKIAGEALGEIASAAYDAPLPAEPKPAAENKTNNNDHDVVIRNDRIIDGSGNP